MSSFFQFKLAIDKDLTVFLHKQLPTMHDFRIISQSLDARNANRGKTPVHHYKIEWITQDEQFSIIPEDFPFLGPLKTPPLIVGAGPAGLFCALRFSEYGIPSIIFERGKPAEKRMLDIAKFWRYGILDPESNVCFGEGGAGLYSDGKLITRVKSPFISYIMNKFVQFGAPAQTAYQSNPHLGSNKIRTVITKISGHLKSKGCQIHTNTQIKEFIFDENKKIKGIICKNGKKYYSDHIILAAGHSCDEIYEHLNQHNVDMKAKDFAIGVRIEHKRRYLDQIQLGKWAPDDPKQSPGPARYRLSHHDQETQRGTYSFCMCPGGHVLSSGTRANGIVVNGMSNFARNSPWSNAALVVSVKAGKDFKSENILDGLNFQRSIEEKAFQYSKERATGKEIPASTIADFTSSTGAANSLPSTSCPSGLVASDLKEILPEFILGHLDKGLSQFDKQIQGFNHKEALLLAPETRTSSPLTILRDPKTLQSTSHSGLYPTGEGAGYAGGITSAAADGVNVAMAIIKQSKDFS